jgi:hypothetical protein
MKTKATKKKHKKKLNEWQKFEKKVERLLLNALKQQSK